MTTTAQTLADQVRAAVNQNPNSALEILSAVEEAISSAILPVATPITLDDGEQVIRVEGHGDYSLDSFFAVDQSQRWTYASSDDFDFDTETVTIRYDSTEDYHSLAYFLDDGDNPLAVDLADNWDERN